LFVNNDDNNISISEDIHPIYGIAKSGKQACKTVSHILG
jgi:hypothetical protein